MALIKKVIEVELLYDDEISTDPADLSLQEIAYEMTEGSMSGVTHIKSEKKLTKRQMGIALQKQGSDPNFLTGV